MKSSLHQCQNCHCSLEEQSNYCDNCGQKKIEHLPSIRELLRDFFSNIWALDSKLLKTMSSLLFRPGKLTLVYLKGRRKGYYTPFKLFLFWLTISFLLIATVVEQHSKFKKSSSYDFELQAYKTITQKNLKAHFQDSTDQVVIDSLLAEGLPDNKSYEENSISIVGLDLSIEDLKNNTAEELIEQKKIESPFRQFIFTQLLKTYKEPRKFKTYVVSHLSWLLLLSIPFLALWMKLLYWRKHPYYIQHLVFLLHLHTFVLAIAAGGAFLLWLYPEWMISLHIFIKLLFFSGFLYSILSLKKVYQQSWKKTFVKFFLVLIGYAFLSFLVTLIFLLINFLLF